MDSLAGRVAIGMPVPKSLIRLLEKSAAFGVVKNSDKPAGGGNQTAMDAAQRKPSKPRPGGRASGWTTSRSLASNMSRATATTPRWRKVPTHAPPMVLRWRQPRTSPARPRSPPAPPTCRGRSLSVASPGLLGPRRPARRRIGSRRRSARRPFPTHRCRSAE